MLDDTNSLNRASLFILFLGISFVLLPLVIALMTATQSYEDFLSNGGLGFELGNDLFENITRLLRETNLAPQLVNSVIIASISALAQVGFCFLAAYALVFFDSRCNKFFFAVLIATVMLPLDLRVITTYQIAANLALPINALLSFTGLDAVLGVIGLPAEYRVNILDTYLGTALPMATNATAMFIFRQTFLSVPKDLPRAAIMDGAGPFRFMLDILVPISKTTLIATLLFFFIGSWTNYLWPLVSAPSPDSQTAVVGLAQLAGNIEEEIPDLPLLMTGALFVSFLPLLVIAFMQRQIVQGLNLSEK